MTTAKSTRPRPLRQRQYPPALDMGHSIRFVKERIAPQKVHYHGLSFHLDAVSLRQIQLARSRDQQLFMPAHFVADLRHYVLFSNSGSLQTDLTFSTFYRFGDYERSVMQTVIALDGDIIHKITAECLQDEHFARDLTQAHYWLIGQLLTRLKLTFRRFLNFFSWGVSIVSVGIYWVCHWQQYLQANWQTKLVELLLMLASSWLLQLVLRQGLKVLLPMLRKLILRRLFTAPPQALQGQPSFWSWLERLG